MMRKYLFCFGLSLMLLNACEEKDQASDLMILSTNEVKINGSTENGIQFSASILLESDEVILEQGFVYGLVAEPDIQDVVLKVPPEGKPQFEIVLENVLRPDTTYYVRSFARTEKFLIYGNEVSFYSNGTEPPVIDSVEPEMAFWGDTILITGKNFDGSGMYNTVWFSEFESTKTWGSRDTLFAIVPDELNRKRSQISVKLFGKESESGKVFEIHSPLITKLSKTNGQFPDTIIISGNHFSEKHGSVEFGGRATRSFASGKDSLMFIVPFLGEEEMVSVHLKQLDEEVLIADKFRYNEQKILGLSGLGIYVTDSITIYAQNIDFRRVDLMVDIDNVSYVNSQVWQDSIRIEPPYYGHENVGAEFSMTCQIYNFISGEFQTIHQQTIPHKSPQIHKVHNPKIAYNGTLVLDVEGYYPGWENTGIFLITQDGSEEEIDWYNYGSGGPKESMNIRISEKYHPGSYTIYVKSLGRASNPVSFEVMLPKVTDFPSGVYKRGNPLLLKGEYLPIESSAYQFRHVESNRVIRYRAGSGLNDFTYLNTNKLMGKGEYQLEFQFGERVYPTGRSITLEDYFVYETTCESFDYTEVKGQVCFANRDKLYYLIYEEAAMRVIDMHTGEVDKIPTNICLADVGSVYYNDHRIFPTIVDDKVYIQHLNHLFEFDFDTHQWARVVVENDNDSILRTANINNELVVTTTTKEVLRYNGAWEKIGQAEFDYFTFGTGDYYYTGYNHGFKKVALSDFKTSLFINSPLGRWDTYYIFRHLFVYKGELYEALNGNYDLEIARFSPSNGTYAKLKPPSISSKTDQTRFFKDINGDVFYLVNNVIYRFIPDGDF